MALTYPIDLLSDLPGWTTEFSIQWRQEQSRSSGGKTYVKDLGDPIWQMSAQSRQLSINELDYWRARLDVMENGLGTFYGWSMSRCRPIKHPGSSTLPTGSLSSITDNKVVGVTGLTGITLSIGDMLQIGDTDLHRIVDTPSAGAYEVRPHIWPGVVTGAAVKISKPSCIMAIVPGSITTTADPQIGWGSISFQAEEAR
jgi:hypothetical protein